MPAEAKGVDLHVVLLRLAAVAGDVHNTLDLLELPLENPVLRGLEVFERVSLADDAVPIELANRIPRRKAGLHPRGERHELDAVDDLLASVAVIARPGEVTFDVAEAEED